MENFKYKYFEFEEPYYALIGAKNKDEAIKIYNSQVDEFDEQGVSDTIREVNKDYAIEVFCKYYSFESNATEKSVKYLFTELESLGGLLLVDDLIL